PDLNTPPPPRPGPQTPPRHPRSHHRQPPPPPGAVRAGLTYPDVKALMAGCLARGTDPDGLDRVVAVVRDGMRPQA
ncbi:hypothetical protein ABZ914_50160, partial [Spirillospora sp. NPDC046719]